MDDLQKKLREGIVSDASFIIPESLGPSQSATKEEVYKLLESAWEEFRDLDFRELHDIVQYLEQQEAKYRTLTRIEDEIINAVHERHTDLETNRIYIELKGKRGQEGVVVGEKIISHRRETNGEWTTRWCFLQNPDKLQQTAYARRKMFFNTTSVIRFRLSVIRVVQWQRAAFGKVPVWEEYWGALSQQEKEDVLGPGRPLAIDSEPETVIKMLDALCDFTEVPEHKSVPFFSRSGKKSMCSHVAEHIDLSQEGARSKIQEVLKQLSSKYELESPAFRTNGKVYFEHRDIILKVRDRFQAEYLDQRTEN